MVLTNSKHCELPKSKHLVPVANIAMSHTNNITATLSNIAIYRSLKLWYNIGIIAVKE